MPSTVAPRPMKRAAHINAGSETQTPAKTMALELA